MSVPVKLIVLGCGSRGTGYSSYAVQHPDEAQIVAIAEPRDFFRNRVGDANKVPEEMRFRDWREALALPKFADAVLICTQDAMHEEPAIRAAELGYAIMLEKPMAPTAGACRRIVAAMKKANVPFAVCHVLRYTAYSRKLKALLDSGAIGDIVTVQHLEGLQPWHQAHSFVRGNWRNEKESSFMLLAKSCHDIDWLRYMVGKKCLRAQSFGSLYHFNAANQPAGAADRCVNCPAGIESLCPYSALKIYMRDRVFKGNFGWPVNVLTEELTREGVLKALQEGPYGRCVYACDNDVVDHQTVNLEFENHRTAGMTMTAFSDEGRHTRILGTHGMIRGDSRMIWCKDFLTGETKEIDSGVNDDGSILSGHGGGDFGLMKSFIHAVLEQDQSLILSGPDETLESHLMVFAAEKSRQTGQIVEL
jgi:predicted dehydrogenase